MNRTEVDIKSPEYTISIESSILSVGSCFADKLGQILSQQAYNIAVNPHGILFNPTSIAKALDSALEDKIRADHFDEYQGIHFHYDYHSKTNGINTGEVEQKIRQANGVMNHALKSGDYLFLTFGTAWVWSLNRTAEVIANCHKVPQKEFSKELLDLETLKKEWKRLVEKLSNLNPKLKIILTVSPVRHSRNGLHQDKLSKSILLLLCDYLEQNFDSIAYFPAYEIMLDELRDYEFYKGNLIHPNQEAVQYIFEKFSRYYLTV